MPKAQFVCFLIMYISCEFKKTFHDLRNDNKNTQVVYFPNCSIKCGTCSDLSRFAISALCVVSANQIIRSRPSNMTLTRASCSVWALFGLTVRSSLFETLYFNK